MLTSVDVLQGNHEIGQKVVVVGGKEPVSAAVVLMLEALLNYYKADIHTSSCRWQSARQDNIIKKKKGILILIYCIRVRNPFVYICISKSVGIMPVLRDIGKKILDF